MSTSLLWVFAGCALIGMGSAAVGSFAFLRKRSLVGDAVAHSLLPGVVLAFLLFQQKELWILFVGALLSGALSMWSIEFISKNSKLSSDAAIAISLSIFFSLGIVLLTYAQQSGLPNQSGLQHFLFGKAAAMLPEDVFLFAGINALIFGCIILLYPQLKLFTFDPAFAKSIGLPSRWINFCLSFLTVLAIASGIQAVGVVLMAAFIFTPPAAARFWTSRLSHMIVLSVIIGLLSAVGGAGISYSASGMPTGPWIIICMSLLAFFTFAFAPKRGFYSRWRRGWRHSRKMKEENVLKTLYHLREREGREEFGHSSLMALRGFDARELEQSIDSLMRKGLIGKKGSAKLHLSAQGLEEARRIVRLHRLWELYLNTRLSLPQDHVHADAEAIEHIITPEVEAALIRDLNYPLSDPHASEIPGIADMKKDE